MDAGYRTTQAARHETSRVGEWTLLVVYHEGGRVEYPLDVAEARALAEALAGHADAVEAGKAGGGRG